MSCFCSHIKMTRPPSHRSARCSEEQPPNLLGLLLCHNGCRGSWHVPHNGTRISCRTMSRRIPRGRIPVILVTLPSITFKVDSVTFITAMGPRPSPRSHVQQSQPNCQGSSGRTSPPTSSSYCLGLGSSHCCRTASRRPRARGSKDCRELAASLVARLTCSGTATPVLGGHGTACIDIWAPIGSRNRPPLLDHV
jgi:hypothetical protein